MKSHRFAIVLVVTFVLASIAGVGALRHHLRLLYPTSETESAFLKSYTPEYVIERFREKYGFSRSRPFGSAAGRTFVTHEAGFKFHVVLRLENWMSLMNALEDDAMQQLANDGAEVLSQSGNPVTDFALITK